MPQVPFLCHSRAEQVPVVSELTSGPQLSHLKDEEASEEKTSTIPLMILIDSFLPQAARVLTEYTPVITILYQLLA